jgi:hypothetical protein
VSALAELDALYDQSDSLKYKVLYSPIHINQHCRDLLNIVEKLQQRAENRPLPKPPLDADAVWSTWSQAGFNPATLDSLQIRTLCVSEKTALRPEVLQLLESEPDILQRASCLVGVIIAYFTHWKRTETSKRAESLIHASLRAYKGKNPTVQRFVREPKELFSPKAASHLANIVLNLATDPGDPFRRLGVSEISGLGEAVAEEAITLWVQKYEAKQASMSGLSACDHLDYAVSKLLRPQTPSESFNKLVRAAISSRWGEDSQVYAQKLRTFVLREPKLGDPRLPQNSANWAAIGQTVKRRFLSWLARDSIIFFFNHVLPDNHDTRRRKDFWLKYHRRIRDFRVALSVQDHQRLRLSSHRDQVAHCSRVHHPTTSAFVMVFEGGGTDYVIVEFSEDGNAAHIWSQQAFRRANDDIRSPSFELTRLKHKPDDDRIIHCQNWEPRAAGKLARLGIRP